MVLWNVSPNKSWRAQTRNLSLTLVKKGTEGEAVLKIQLKLKIDSFHLITYKSFADISHMCKEKGSLLVCLCAKKREGGKIISNVRNVG